MNKNKDLINDFLKESSLEDRGNSIRDLLNEFGAQSNVEKVGAEATVVDGIIKGISIRKICDNLRVKYPNYKFGENDIKLFLDRNRQIVRKLEGRRNVSALRHINAITQIEEELSGLYLFTKKLLKKFESEGDNNATLGAINALNKTLVNFAKLKGYGAFAPKSGTNIEINVDGERRRNAKTLEANFDLVDKVENGKKSEGDLNSGTVSKE